MTGIVIRLCLGPKAGTTWCRRQIDADGTADPFIDAGWGDRKLDAHKEFFFWRP